MNDNGNLPIDTVICGDCLKVMKEWPAAGVDCIVTDPPYGLSFMGKDWDHGVPGIPFWREALRVAKPGAMMLAFGGTRTSHRLACAIEDAGWEIRDCIMWIYGSGFPKSLDISKAIDKVNGENGRAYKFTKWMRTKGLTAGRIDEITGTHMGSHYLTDKSQPAIPTRNLFEMMRPYLGNVPKWVNELVCRTEAEREIVGSQTKARSTSGRSALPTMGADVQYQTWDITAPATGAAKEWDGWGTALKPAYEPILLCMKPLDGTFAENALKHGVAGINIDECRVGSDAGWSYPNGRGGSEPHHMERGERNGLADKPSESSKGRWPANLIHDGSEEVVREFPDSSITGKRRDLLKGYHQPEGGEWFGRKNHDGMEYQDSGSAARFFYCAKASRAERNRGCEGLPVKRKSNMQTANGTGRRSMKTGFPDTYQGNYHPTVKPVALMKYLVKMVSREGHVVLDPFAGSGTTGMACEELGRHYILIDTEEGYCEISRSRIRAIPATLPFGAGK